MCVYKRGRERGHRSRRNNRRKRGISEGGRRNNKGERKEEGRRNRAKGSPLLLLGHRYTHRVCPPDLHSASLSSRDSGTWQKDSQARVHMTPGPRQLSVPELSALHTGLYYMPPPPIPPSPRQGNPKLGGPVVFGFEGVRGRPFFRAGTHVSAGNILNPRASEQGPHHPLSLCGRVSGSFLATSSPVAQKPWSVSHGSTFPRLVLGEALFCLFSFPSILFI